MKIIIGEDKTTLHHQTIAEPWMFTWLLSGATEAAFRQYGAEAVSLTLIASASNGAYPHHHSGERRL